MYEALKHVQLYFALVDPLVYIPDHTTLSATLERALALAQAEGEKS